MNEKVFRLFEEYTERKKREKAEEALAHGMQNPLKKGQSKTKREVNKGENETPGLDDLEGFTAAQQAPALKLGLK